MRFPARSGINYRSVEDDSGQARAVSMNEPDSCCIEERHTGQVVVLAVTGTLDALTAPQLQVAIGAAAQKRPSAVLVDMTGVEFLASAGMGVLVAAHADLAPAVRIAVVADGPATSRPLTLIGITKFIDLFATLEEALSGLAD